MLQRIQTVYLALGGTAAAVALFLRDPIVTTMSADIGWYAPVRMFVALAVALTAVIAVFLYGKRAVQQRVTFFSQLLALVLVVLTALGTYLTWPISMRFDFIVAVSMVLPAASYILLSLARRAIVRDINLVKSMDRLR